MRIRDVYLANEQVIADTQALTIDINIVDPISYLEVIVQATGGATSVTDHEVHDDVAKVEVVDGSNVIESLTMVEWQALNFYAVENQPLMKLSENAAAVQREGFVIPFGRFLGDPNYYLLPSKFRNPQFKINVTLTISATVGFATGSGRVTVIAHVIEDGAGTWMGTIMAKELDSFTSAATGVRRTEMPCDYPYLGVMIKSLLTLNKAEAVITNMELELDSRKFVPANLSMAHLAEMNRQWFGAFLQDKICLKNDTGTSLLDLYDIAQATCSWSTTLQPAQIIAITAERITFGAMLQTVAPAISLDATARVRNVFAKGFEPHGCLYYPFGRRTVDSDWLVVPNYKNFNAWLTQGAAGACAVVGEQVLR